MGGEDAFRRVLDGALDAVIATDREGSIVGWNRAAETLLGWHKDEVLGRRVYDVIVPPRYRDEFVRQMRATPFEDVSAYHERLLLARDGTLIPVDASIAAIRL